MTYDSNFDFDPWFESTDHSSDLNPNRSANPDADSAEPIPPVVLPPATDPHQEQRWLETTLQNWLDREFIPEAVNATIARQASQAYMRQRMEGENDLGSLVLAILTEMQGFDFSKSFFSEFAVANAVGDLLMDSLGIDRCCGQE